LTWHDSAVKNRELGPLERNRDMNIWVFRAITPLIVLLLAHSAAADAIDTRDKGASGNPIPRFVSISASEANMRSGPGTEYPIRWTFKARGLPVEVIDEDKSWRKVRDIDGEEGWIHVRLLSSRRTAIIMPGEAWLYKKPNPDSRLTVIAKQNAWGALVECDPIWCEMAFETGSGWIERSQIWGLYPFEEWD